jgi:hypothetical protein
VPTGGVEALGGGVYLLVEPSEIVARDAVGNEVARFDNWNDADDFIAEAMRTGGEYTIFEEPLTEGTR